MLRSFDPLYPPPNRRMMEELTPLRDSAQSIPTDSTPLMPDGPSRTYEPIRGTNDSLGLDRFTATGQPMPRYQHDHYTNMMSHGSGSTTAGANLLPFRYTDASIITIPINLSDLPPDRSVSLPDSPSLAIAEAASDQPKEKKGKAGSFFRRISSATQGEKEKNSKKEIKAVRMTRGEYLQYWAKDEKGNYREGVVDPPGGRREWVRRQVELNEEWDREDREKGRRTSVIVKGLQG
ncbi:hypothetical protein EV356DRAFT_498105 [Viridothelium virens]|uniref:Uncharacterized protein n=1 Tax=Viridothelium virens TaxID=1048519 RepID=A0A6A6HFE4_VIRVR|nr:hypothetical protein EV356DRAFT_498105 [Viridothelium virens]